MMARKLMVVMMVIFSFSANARTALGDVVYLIQNPVFGSHSSSSSSSGGGFEEAFVYSYAETYFENITYGQNEEILVLDVEKTPMKDFGSTFSKFDYYDIEISVSGVKYQCDFKMRPLSSNGDSRDKVITIDDCSAKGRFDINFLEITLRPRSESETKNKGIVNSERKNFSVKKSRNVTGVSDASRTPSGISR